MRLCFFQNSTDHSLGEIALLGVCRVGEESRKGFLFQPQLSAVLKSSEALGEVSQPGLQALQGAAHPPRSPSPAWIHCRICAKLQGTPLAFPALPFQASFCS